MAATKEPGEAYTLDEAYEAALRVQSINARLRIARELAPKAVEAPRVRWGQKPAAAHAAVEAAPLRMGAAGPAVSGGSGACHNCGEVRHYRSTCPHPRRNSSGRGQTAGGRGGGGRGLRACFVCGDTTHLAAQCAKRAVPAVAAAAPVADRVGPGGSISAADYKAFHEWFAMSQAVAAQTDEHGEEDEGDWDEFKYGLGAVALPLSQQGQPLAPMAAAGTRAGAEKAKLTWLARAKTGGGDPKKIDAAGGLGTAQIAPPVDLAAVEALKARRDKAAAKKRLARLPDHGRHVAPQGLNRLPKEFAVSGQPTGGGESGVSVKPVVPVAQNRAGRQTEPRVAGAPAQGAEPVLAGTVMLELGAFLALARRAGLGLDEIAEMAGQGAAPAPQPVEGTGTGGATARLSPIAQKVLRARAAGVPQSETARAELQDSREGRAVSWARVATGRPVDGAVLRAAPTLKDEPESSRMAEERAARGQVLADARVAREIAEQEEAEARAAREEQAVATSRDAELAMEMVAREAQERGVDRAAALAAQEMGVEGEIAAAHEDPPATGKGKEKLGEPRALKADLKRGLAYEKKLGAGAWRGSDQVASVTLQAAAYAHTKAMACFAEGQPRVSPEQRGGVEGSPDWVANEKGAVQVMTPHGLVAPKRVLIEGGSFYSMVGAKLKAQIGLQPEDMDAVGHRVHTATGKVEALQGGLTKKPVPIVLNAGTPSELTLYERPAVTDSTWYDLLVGTRAAYPSGLSVDRWREEAVYRVDWDAAGQNCGTLPMRLHQKRAVDGPKGGHKGQAGAALACCLTK